ncbi:MAG: hypothetical protein ABEN55_06225 [Bradymonadaceae bacterium]
MNLFDHIEDLVDRALKSRRLGFYVGVVSHALRSLRRVDVDAEWGPTMKRLRRISSPILDVIPATGTRMAVLSQDGVPSLGAILGQVWDDAGTADDMTAWLRANLEEKSGHLELGAEEGLRIKVGQNAAEIEKTEDGRIVIESEGSGTVRIKNGSHELLERLSTTLGKLSEALNTLANDKVATAIGAQPLNGAATYATLKGEIDTLQSHIDQLRG